MRKQIHPRAFSMQTTILHTNGATSRNSRFGVFALRSNQTPAYEYYEISDVDVFLFQQNLSLSNQGKDPFALFKKR